MNTERRALRIERPIPLCDEDADEERQQVGNFVTAPKIDII